MNELKAISNKKLGKGSISLVLSIIAIMSSFTYLSGEEKPVGAILLNSIGIYKMTNIISLLLFIVSIWIGNKYKQHLGAKSGKVLSIVIILLIFALTIVSLMHSYNK